MTRDEFIQNVTTWSELRSFCHDYECSVLAKYIHRMNWMTILTSTLSIWREMQVIGAIS